MSQTKEILPSAETKKRKNLDMRAGDTVRVSVKIEERGKTRTQEFEGIVLARKHGNEPGATFTVRRTSGGLGVEKIFPLFSPLIEKIEVIKRSKVRQANLYHIRRKAAKEVKRYIKNVRNTPDVIEEEETKPELEEKTEELKEKSETEEKEKPAEKTENVEEEKGEAEETENEKEEEKK